MSSMVTNYKCPACTGPLHFVGGSGRLECDYCGSTYDVAEIEALSAESEAKAESAFQAQGEWDASGLSEEQWGADGMRVYNCPSCGAELICDETTAATSCPYCGNTTVVPGQFSGAMKPEFVLPFKLDKAAAVEALGRHYQKKRFLPKTFADKNHIEEVQGVYVPFWLFDGTADASADYEATRSHSRREGQYQVTTTEHYDVHRAGRLSFEKVPVDASVRMPDDHMDSIEPYDYGELKDFSTAYLPGFLADKYDVSAEDSAERADRRCENSALSALAGTVTGYETCTPRGHNVRLQRGKVHYALLPVWLLNTKWNGQDFLFAMNGQTGKLAGDLPVDKGRFWTMFAAIAFPLAAALAALLYLFSGEGIGTCVFAGLIAGCVIALIVCLIFRAQMKSVKKATAAQFYTVPDSLEIYESSDRFSHVTETRVKVESDRPNRSGGK